MRLELLLFSYLCMTAVKYLLRGKIWGSVLKRKTDGTDHKEASVNHVAPAVRLGHVFPPKIH